MLAIGDDPADRLGVAEMAVGADGTAEHAAIGEAAVHLGDRAGSVLADHDWCRRLLARVVDHAGREGASGTGRRVVRLLALGGQPGVAHAVDDGTQIRRVGLGLGSLQRRLEPGCWLVAHRDQGPAVDPRHGGFQLCSEARNASDRW